MAPMSTLHTLGTRSTLRAMGDTHRVAIAPELFNEARRYMVEHGLPTVRSAVEAMIEAQSNKESGAPVIANTSGGCSLRKRRSRESLGRIGAPVAIGCGRDQFKNGVTSPTGLPRKEKGYNMKKSRPWAAMFAVVVLAALVVLSGCQGAVGPKGPKGDPGDDGTSGTPGTPGTPGVSALVATADIQYVLVSDKIVGTAPAFGDKPADFDVSGHFQGGTGDLTFTDSGEVEFMDDKVSVDNAGVPVPDADPLQYYEVKVSEAGMASLTVRAGAAEPTADPDGEVLVAFIVTATDDNGRTAKKTIVVQRNKAPAPNANPAITIEDLALGVGTQAVENPIAVDTDASPAITAAMVTADKALRPMLNQYRLTMVTETHFTDADFASLTFTAKSSAPAVASATVDKQVIVITGYQGTDDDSDTAAPDAPTITVTAIDAGMLESAPITFDVTVLAAPKAVNSIGAQTYPIEDDKIALVSDIGEYFEPTTLVAANFTAESSDSTKVEIDAPAVTGTDLMGRPKNPGSSTITVTGTDVLRQSATQTFTATVIRSTT